MKGGINEMSHVHVQTLLSSEEHKELKLLSIRESTTVKKLIKGAILNYLTLKGGNNGKSKEIE